jgi:hypothetical protein
MELYTFPAIANTYLNCGNERENSLQLKDDMQKSLQICNSQIWICSYNSIEDYDSGSFVSSNDNFGRSHIFRFKEQILNVADRRPRGNIRSVSRQMDIPFFYCMKKFSSQKTPTLSPEAGTKFLTE